LPLSKKNNRVLVLEGFCYSPSKEKRDMMLELEAIKISFHWENNNLHSIKKIHKK
jgi:hypothetical protein